MGKAKFTAQPRRHDLNVHSAAQKARLNCKKTSIFKYAWCCYYFFKLKNLHHLQKCRVDFPLSQISLNKATDIGAPSAISGQC